MTVPYERVSRGFPVLQQIAQRMGLQTEDEWLKTLLEEGLVVHKGRRLVFLQNLVHSPGVVLFKLPRELLIQSGIRHRDLPALKSVFDHLQSVKEVFRVQRQFDDLRLSL